MTNIEAHIVDQKTTTIKISKKTNEILSAYKILIGENKTKEQIVEEILNTHLTTFKARLEGLKFK